FLMSSSIEAATYIFKNNLWTNCNILSDKDQSTLKNLEYIEKKRVKGWDGRKRNADGWYETSYNYGN
ncbi:hypothetical protein N9S91_04825, partial [Candidatus Pelagibacter sp.]|nr:hypothetical protein [Candidatus Pelagibacter sp.]